MAVVPKQKGNNQRYDPSQELTQDQLHRFGQVASTAQKRRERLAENPPSVMAEAKEVAFKPVIRPKKDKPNTARYAIWMLVVMIFCLWLMYMTS